MANSSTLSFSFNCWRKNECAFSSPTQTCERRVGKNTLQSTGSLSIPGTEGLSSKLGKACRNRMQAILSPQSAQHHCSVSDQDHICRGDSHRTEAEEESSTMDSCTSRWTDRGQHTVALLSPRWYRYLLILDGTLKFKPSSSLFSASDQTK